MKPKKTDFLIQKWFDGELGLREISSRIPSKELVEILKKRNELEQIGKLIDLCKAYSFPLKKVDLKVWDKLQKTLFTSGEIVIDRNHLDFNQKKRRSRTIILVASLLLFLILGFGFTFNLRKNKKLEASKNYHIMMDKIIKSLDQRIKINKMRGK